MHHQRIPHLLLLLFLLPGILAEEKRPSSIPVGFSTILGKNFVQDFISNDPPNDSSPLILPQYINNNNDYNSQPLQNFFKHFYIGLNSLSPLNLRLNNENLGRKPIMSKKSVLDRLPASLRGRFVGVRGKKNFDGYRNFNQNFRDYSNGFIENGVGNDVLVDLDRYGDLNDYNM